MKIRWKNSNSKLARPGGDGSWPRGWAQTVPKKTVRHQDIPRILDLCHRNKCCSGRGTGVGVGVSVVARTAMSLTNEW
jgi:hypothetical protein